MMKFFNWQDQLQVFEKYFTLQQALKIRRLEIKIYCYCNSELVVTIAKIVQNLLEAAKEKKILRKIEILEKKFMLHKILTQILNNP